MGPKSALKRFKALLDLHFKIQDFLEPSMGPPKRFKALSSSSWIQDSRTKSSGIEAPILNPRE